MANYRVTAPYVLLKVLDRMSGKAQINGFYKGAIVNETLVDEATLSRHLDRAWIEPVADVQPVPETSPDPDDTSPPPPNPEAPPPARPSQADPKAAWVDYAVAQGADRVEADAMTKADLIDLLK